MTTASATAATATPPGSAAWFALDVEAVVAGLGSDTERGLTSGDAASRLARFGPNEITKEKPPSVWVVALGQLRDPMNIMLIAVIVVSLLISQFSTAVIVGLPRAAQRGPGVTPGAQGAGERRRAVPDAGPPGEGRPGRRAGARAGVQTRAG